MTDRPRPPAHYNPDPRFGLRIPYGILDIDTLTWTGSEVGPNVYFDHRVALVGATVLSYRYGAHLIAAMLPPGPWRRRPDDFTPQMTVPDSWAVAEGEMNEGRALRRFRQDAEIR